MRVALIGYGKMGQELEKVFVQRDHEIFSRIDSKAKSADFREVCRESVQNADVCVDFTHPKSVLENIKRAANLGKNIVVGTTGWADHLDEVKEVVEKYDIGFLFAPNFSIGVNIFLKVLKEAAQIIHRYEEYDVAGVEVHHNQKVDKPSGTALLIKEEIFKNVEFASVRSGNNPGEHEIIFDSPFDTISLKHSARSRAGFAYGVVIAAEWLLGRKGFYELGDML